MVARWQSFCFLSIPSGQRLPTLPVPGAAGTTCDGLDLAWLDMSSSIAQAGAASRH